ncbi:MAG: hypothetical protein JXR70_12460 [Spirochaetales bacterium]|nr:hypothetical protein [Spirochaetales bacterium]
MNVAREPEIFQDYILFTYKSERPARYVAAVFEHEDFCNFRMFKVNEENVYFLLLPVPDNITTLRYRYIVDGLYMINPYEKDFEHDQEGYKLSVFRLPAKSIKEAAIRNPKIEGKRVSFIYKGQPGHIVNLVSNFSSWDPFLYPLSETSSGYYEIELFLGSGEYYYYFLDNGQKILDPYNREIYQDSARIDVNYFRVP